MHLYSQFYKLAHWFHQSFYSFRVAGQLYAVLHQRRWTNTVVSSLNSNQPLYCRIATVKWFTLILSSASVPSVADRVLEKTSLREKMAKYQAAVTKQVPAQAVSSCKWSQIKIMFKVIKQISLSKIRFELFFDSIFLLIF